MTSDHTDPPGSDRPEPSARGTDGPPDDDPSLAGSGVDDAEPDATAGADVEVDDAPVDAGTDGDDSGDDDEPESPSWKRDARVRSAVEWVAVIAGAVVVALVVRTFLFTTFWIPSGSMEPTLMGGDRRDRVVVNRLAYQWGEPERGDIIVFKVPEGEPVTALAGGQEVNDLIKRVIGLPGETITLEDGQVYVDGELLDEPYLREGTRTDPAPGRPERDTFEVPEDAVFVMGDNRTNSHDARAWEHPWVPEEDIVGEAFLRIWPLGEIGGI